MDDCGVSPNPLLVADVHQWVASAVAAGSKITAPVVSRGNVTAVTIDSTRIVSAGAWGWEPPELPSRTDPDEEIARWAEKLWDAVESAGVPAADTPPGIASALVRSAVAEANAEIPDVHTRRSLRAAYRGGYGAIPRFRYEGPVVHVDRNSSYPAQIRLGVPAGYVPASAAAEIRPEGIYRARVFVPHDVWLPPLSVRLPSGAIAEPIGSVTGVFVGCELLFALEIGCRLERVYGGWIPTKRLDFSATVDRLYEIRRLGSTGRWAKTVLNSIAGILGKREFVTAYKVGEIPTGWRAANVDGIDLGYREVWAPSKYSQPGGAAWVTASARVELLRVAYELGPENILYLDTDGIVAVETPETRQAIERRLGPNMGDWKLVRTSDSYSCGALRRIAFGFDSHLERKLHEIPTGAPLCGRLTCGSGTVPGTVEDLVAADRRQYSSQGRIWPGNAGRAPEDVEIV